MGMADCPDRAELRRIRRRKSCPARCSRSRRPRRALPACEATLQALDRLADPLLSQLRRLDGPDDSEAEPVPDALIAAVRSARPRGGAAAWFAADDCHHRLGKFELVERLGAGSYGYVFRARDVELGRIGGDQDPEGGKPGQRRGRRRGSCARPAARPSSSTPASSRFTRPARPTTGRSTWSRSSSRGRRWRASWPSAIGRSRFGRRPSSSPRWPTPSTTPTATG